MARFADIGSFVNNLLPGLAFQDKLDYTYYLLEGRPLKAAEMVRQDIIQAVSATTSETSTTGSPPDSPATSFSTMALTAGASGEKNLLASSQQRQDQHLGQMWKQTVFETVARLACDNFFNSTIVSSCIFFFDQ